MCVKPTLETFGVSCCSLCHNSVAISADDITLERLLHTDEGLASFTNHLVREFSSENIGKRIRHDDAHIYIES